MLGLNLFHKMIRIVSTLGTLKISLDNAFARVKAHEHPHNWQIVMPIANFPDRVKFTPERLTEKAVE